MAVTGYGKCLEIENDGTAGGAGNVTPVFSFSYGPLWAIAVPRDSAFKNLFMTGGDDKWLCLWNNWYDVVK